MSEAAEPIGLGSPNRVEDDLLRPITEATRNAWLVAVALLIVVAGSAAAYVQQIATGPRPSFVAIYLTSLVFLLGLSQAGPVLVSLLTIAGGDWRRPFARVALAFPVFAPFGLLMLIGLNWILPWPAWRSLWSGLGAPLLWDTLIVAIYYALAIFLLYLHLIPDLAIQRDRASGWRSSLYRALSRNWQGTDSQWRSLRRTMLALGIFIIIAFVAVQSIMAIEFSMALLPGWASAVFLPWTVVSLFFGGIAALAIALAIIRRVFKLQEYLTADTFHNLGKMLLALTTAFFYLWFSQFLPFWYSNIPREQAILSAETIGFNSVVFWLAMLGSFFIPFFGLVIGRVRKSIGGIVVVSVAVVVGIALHRYLTVAPGVATKFPEGMKDFSWVDAAPALGALAGYILLFILFARLFPILSVWEIKEWLRRTKQLRIGHATVKALVKSE